MAKPTNSKKPTAYASRRTLSVKVSEKGALSIYGLQRFPVSLYADQWLDILDHADKIKAFIDANGASLKDKPTEGSNVSGATAL